MREVNLATLSYGHGIAVTPIQMINAISVVANGGNLMTPRVVERITDGDVLIKEYQPEIKNRVISKDIADKILNMLELAVIDGTGKKAYVPGYRVGGKTGTAQKVIDGKYASGKYISSFGGVAPVDDPKITVLVIVDEPTGIYYGGTVAGPAAQYIIENTLSYMQVPRVYTEKEIENIETEIVIPNLIGMTIREAGETLTNLGLKYVTQYQVFTEDAKIINHFPVKDTIVNKDSIIDLYLDAGEVDELQDQVENNYN
jgi:stage V sporulation protein D (sporulation-specific penicillin-binding protein)